MKRLSLLLLVLSALGVTVNAQIEISEDFENGVEKLADRVELLTGRVASRAEALAERFEDKDVSLKVNLNVPVQKARLGVQLKDLPLEKARRLGFDNVYGSMIVRVFANSPADEAGLKPFDYLIGINGAYVNETRSFSDMLHAYEPGDRIQVHFIRAGEERSVDVQLDESGRIGYVFSSRPLVWLGVSPAIQERATDYDGVSIRVSRNSPAAKMGLQDGNVIKEINGKPILEWDDLRIALTTVDADEEIAVVYERGGELHETSGKPGSRLGNVRIEVPEVVIEPEEFQIEIPEEVVFADVEDIDDDLYWQETDKPFIGVYVEDISKEKAAKLGFDNPYGTYVSGIVPGSAAEKAGLKPLDYIYGVDEFRVGEEQSLASILKRYKPGDSAVLHIFRKGKKQTVNITFGKYEAKREKPQPANDCEDPFFGIIQKFNSEVSEGIPISVVEGSTAEVIGLKKGDVLLTINGHKMVDWDDVKIAINSIQPGETIEVTWLRNGEQMKGKAAMKSLAETKNCENCDCGEDVNAVVRINEVPKISPRYKDPTLTEKVVERRRSLDHITMKVEDGNQDIDRLKAAGLIGSAVGAGLQLQGFQLKADAGSGEFVFGFDLPSSGDLEIKVIDEDNLVIYEAELIDYSGRFEDTLDLAQKVPGIYTIVVIQNGKAAVKKVSLS